MTERHRAKRGLRIPMPDRPGQFLTADGEGTVLDLTNPYYFRLAAEGSIVVVAAEADPEGEPPPPPPPPPAKPVTPERTK